MDSEQLIGQALVEAWNSQHPPGTPVIVVQDDGSRVLSETRSPAWKLGHGEAVVSYDGRSGGYALSRVVPMAHVPQTSMTFVDRIMRDAVDDGASLCLLNRFREVATVLAPFVPESKDVKYAAFVHEDEEEGEASIVVQSLRSSRRVNVDLLGDPLNVVTLDEDMKRRDNKCSPDNHDFLAAAIRWCVDGGEWPSIEAKDA